MECEHPSIRRERHEERRPRPSSHQVGWKDLSQSLIQATVVVTPVISLQTAKPSAITWRQSVADSRCRRGRKWGEMPPNGDRSRCACRTEVKRFIARSRCRVDW